MTDPRTPTAAAAQGEGAARVSRAGAVKLGAAGLASAVGAALLAPGTASAETDDTSFFASNPGPNEEYCAFCVSIPSQPGYQYGLIAHANSGSGVFATNNSPDLPTVYATSVGQSGAVWGISTSSEAGFGVSGWSQAGTGHGVSGLADGTGDGVHGEASTKNGVSGVGGTAGDGVHGSAPAGNGVSGTGTAAGVSGVYGEHTGAGFGVAGRCADPNGTAVYADAGFTGHSAVIARAPNTIAIDARGAIQSDRSGVAIVKGSIASSKDSIKVTVPGQALTAASLVLATIQGTVPTGTYVQNVAQTGAGTSFTINLNQPVTTHVKIGWFVVN